MSRLWNADADEDSCFSSWRRTHLYNEVHRQLTSGEGTMFVDWESRRSIHVASQGDPRLQAATLSAQSLKNGIRPAVLEDGRTNGPEGRISIDESAGAVNSSSQLEHPGSVQQSPPNNVEDKFPIIPQLFATQLLQHYMKNTNTWLPIMNQAEIMRLLYRYNQGHALELDEQALFGAIVAYSTIQLSANADAEEYQTIDDSLLDTPALHEKARKLLPTHSDNGRSIAYVQAMAILAMISIGQSDWQEAWSMLGRAIRLATYLKLAGSQQASHTATLHYGAGRGTHTFLACFALETMVAVRLGLTPHLHSEDLTAVEAIDCSGMDEWEPWSGASQVSNEFSTHHGPSFSASTFNGLINTAKLLQSIATLQQDSSRSAETCLALWEHFRAERRKIEEQLESTLGCSTMSASMLPHQIFLCFALETAQSTLYRCVPGLFCPSTGFELEEEVGSLTGRIGRLLQRQTQHFKLSAAYPLYKPLIEMTFDNIGYLQGFIGSSDHVGLCVSEAKLVAQSLAAVWTPAKSANEGSQNSQEISDYDGPLVEPEAVPHLVQGLSSLAKASLSTTARIPNKLDSMSPPFETLRIPATSDVKNLGSNMNTVPVHMQSTKNLSSWPCRMPDTSIFKNVNSAPASAAENLEGACSLTTSSLGDQDFESAFHEMMSSEADSW